MIFVQCKGAIWVERVEVVVIVYISPTFGEYAVEGGFVFPIAGNEGKGSFYFVFLGGICSMGIRMSDHVFQLTHDVGMTLPAFEVFDKSQSVMLMEGG